MWQEKGEREREEKERKVGGKEGVRGGSSHANEHEMQPGQVISSVLCTIRERSVLQLHM